MLRCYQCEEEAIFYTKKTKRLFCSPSHQTLYIDGWKRLLRQTVFRRQAFLHLGMKRAHSDESTSDEDEDEEEILIDRLEKLPTEIIVEILLATFADFTEYSDEMRDLFRVREISCRLKVIIDGEILAKVKRLVDQDIDDLFSSGINDKIGLFTGLKELRCYNEGNKLTDEGLLCLSSHLEKLYLFDSGSLTKQGLQKMTALRSLSLGYFFTVGVSWLSVLTNLTTLGLLNTNQSGEEDFLQYLPGLKQLTIGRECLIQGESFKFLTQLERLRLSSNYTVSDSALVLLAPSLRQLTLEITYSGLGTAITDRGLSKMSLLEKLDLTFTKLVTDEGLRALVSLKQLVLLNMPHITDRGIACMTNISSLRIRGYDEPNTFTVEQLIALSKTLEDFTICEYTWINWQTLQQFPRLKALYMRYGCFNGATEEERVECMTVLRRVKNERGVRIRYIAEPNDEIDDQELY